MKIWKITSITFALGIATGAGSLSLYNWMQVDVDNYPSIEGYFTTDDPVRDLETTKLLARIAEQRGEIERLKSQLDQQPRRDRDRQDEEELTEEELEQRRAERREEMRDRFMAEMAKREEQRIQELVDKYGLSEAQRQLLVQIMEQQRKNAEARRAGEQVEPFNFDAAMAGIMTDDQYAKYVDDTQKQIYNRADQMARSQVDQISRQLRLNNDQQQLMYEAINYTAQEMMIARQAGQDFDMRQVMQERLSTILSPQQLEAYEGLLQQGGDRTGIGRPGGGGGGGRPGGGGGRGGGGG